MLNALGLYSLTLVSHYRRNTTLKKHILALTLLTSITALPASHASENIVIQNPGLYPEGVSFNNKEQSFYIGSLARGEIWRIGADGSETLFIKDDRLASTVGIEIDHKGNRLIACVSDPGVSQHTSKDNAGRLAAVAIYDLSSGQELAYHRLAHPSDTRPHFANDVTVDEQGNAYVTDSFSPAIYRISAKGEVSVWASSTDWQTEAGQWGLNGIEYHSKGFLIVSLYHNGKLYKVSTATPNSVREITPRIEHAQWSLSGVDGLYLGENNTLIAINNAPPELGSTAYKLTSSDNWQSYRIASAIALSNTFPTTVTQGLGQYYVLHAKLGELFSGNKNPAKTFELQPLMF